MKITLDPRKTLIENTVFYREEAKKCRAKALGAERALQETQKQVEKQQLLIPIQKRKREWFELFHFFHTSENTLVVGGKNAKQNDLLFSKHAGKGEWFMHAEIRGAPAVIVKNLNASEEELQQAAQFAASYSSAWKRGFGSIDVYAVKVEQVSKHFQGGFLDQGAFAISGQRKWFKDTLLGLYICLNAETFKPFVRINADGLRDLCVFISPGGESKESVSKSIKARFAKTLFERGKKVKLDEEEIAKLLPGNCAVRD